ncbi:MAG: MlaD family protein [Thermodesulfobacteriota bacterium]|nr:MlaD family protein [Thermodesulfobacteriota bacterium]
MNNEAKVGIFVFSIIIIFIVLSINIGEMELNKKKTYPATMIFSSVEGLKVGSPLELAGVKVGSVTNIELKDDFSAVVSVCLHEDIHLPMDTSAGLATKGILGDKIIDLKPGASANTLEPGGILARTTVPPSMDFLLTKLGEVSENLADLSSSFNTVLGDEDNLLAIRGTIKNMHAFSRDASDIFSENRDSISSLISGIEDTSVNITKASQELVVASSTFNHIIEGLDSGQGTMGMLLKDDSLYLNLSGLIGRLNRFTSQMNEENNISLLLSDANLYYNLAAITQNLRCISDEVAKGEGTLGHILMDERLYQDMEKTLDNADRALQGIEEQTPISVMGTVLGVIW